MSSPLHILLCPPHYTFCCVLPTTHPAVFSPLDTLLCSPHYTPCCVLPTTHPAVFSPLYTLLCSPHYTPCCVLPTVHPAVFSPLHTLLCSPHYTPYCVLPTTHPAVFSSPHILLCSPHYKPCCVLPTTHPVVKKVLRTHLPSDVILISATSAGVPTNAPMPPAVTPIKAFMAKLGGFPSLAATETNTSLVSCSGACLYYMCQPTPLPKTKQNKKQKHLDLFQKHVLKFGNVP